MREIARAHDRFGAQYEIADGTGPDVDWHRLTDSISAPASRLAEIAKLTTQRKAGTGSVAWLDILLEEVAEAFAESDPAALRAELLQVAAVAIRWIVAIDHRSAD